MKKIIITGGTGYIGKALVDLLKPDYDLVILTRHPALYHDLPNLSYQFWDGRSTITKLLEGAYGIINLSGENIGAKRWTTSQKKRIVSSRIEAAKAIKKSIEQIDNAPKVWIQASATGYYGNSTSENPFDEYSPKGENTFLSKVCEEWESPIQQLKKEETRKVIIRSGVVLARDCELLKQFNTSFIFRVAAVVGSGNDYMPWIHIKDEAAAIRFLLETESCAGVYNLCSPTSASISKIVNEIKSYRKSFVTMKIPRYLLTLLFGAEKTDELILANQKVYPKRLLKSGFKFKYDNIQQAMHQIYQN